MSIYKNSLVKLSDFVKKDEKISHGYMKIVEKVGNIIKKNQ